MKARTRLARETDIDAVFEIRTSVTENHLSLAELERRGVTRQTVRDAISAAPCLWIAGVEGVPAAFSMADMERGCVFALFVRPEMEGRGLGRLLLAEAEAFLFAKHRAIWLETEGGSRASGFYRKLGWTAVETLEDGAVRFEKARPGRG